MDWIKIYLIQDGWKSIDVWMSITPELFDTGMSISEEFHVSGEAAELLGLQWISPLTLLWI